MDHDAKRGEGAEEEENSEVLHVVVASREALKCCWSFEYFDRFDGTVSLIKLYIFFI